MNPPQFVLDMLKKIESRGDTQTKTNTSGDPVVLYGVTDGERKIIDLFKGGNLNPKSYSPLSEGLNPLTRQIVRINGYDYYYNNQNNKLYSDENMTNEVNRNQLTSNESHQLSDQIRFTRHDLNEGLNLPYKPVDSGPLKDIPGHGNKGVTQHFFSDQINSRIVEWGTINLKIKK